VLSSLLSVQGHRAASVSLASSQSSTIRAHGCELVPDQVAQEVARAKEEAWAKVAAAQADLKQDLATTAENGARLDQEVRLLLPSRQATMAVSYAVHCVRYSGLIMMCQRLQRNEFVSQQREQFDQGAGGDYLQQARDTLAQDGLPDPSQGHSHVGTFVLLVLFVLLLSPVFN
jgi:hypothetical protein